ncbi:7253_t:CDS:2 [Gigaspora margarita]|uniref:7253_t:CDS:1 n=1 Tax=Gigaspora margarita TaxID=4874 RepID=A0ABN7VHY1_GIGMA|nr:7253_t:CDS:2 [Gigaspora margarita]
MLLTYMATPMLILPIAYNQDGNAERLELVACLALKLSNLI